MTGPDNPEMFDTATRDRVRRKILNHMKEHGIGVHRLAARIEAANRLKPEIPIKTLQRFLAASHRTNDMYVRFFEQFAESLPDADPIGELGRAMAAFHGSQDVKHFGGAYTSLISSEQGSPNHSELSITADDKFCRVVERSTSGRSMIYDGALIGHGKTALIALQDRTTKAPKQYLIGAEGEGYAARGTEAIFASNAEHTVHTLSGWIAVQGSEPKRPAAGFLPPSSGTTPPALSRGPAPVVRTSDPLTIPAFRVHAADRANASVETEKKSLLERLSAMLGRSRREPQHPPYDTKPGTGAGNDEPLEILDSLVPEHLTTLTSAQLQAAFLAAAEQANEAELKRLVDEGVDIDKPDAATGLTALHLSVGRNATGSVRYLLEHGAMLVPDGFGRMPSVIAAECEVTEELSDLIAEAEAKLDGV